jgi:hypothetical protein
LIGDNATSFLDALRLITVPSVAPLSEPEKAPAAKWIDRSTLHDAAIGVLDTEHEDLTDVTRSQPELTWLDGSDLATTQVRFSKVVDPAKAAVEQLLATL